MDGLKNKVKSKLVHFWDGKEDLHGKISISLIKAMNTNPRIGWTRADEAIGSDVTKELSRLSSENSMLRNENKKLLSKHTDPVDEVREVVNILNENSRTLTIRPEASWDTAEEYTRTLLNLFLAAAPNLILENTTEGISENICFSIVGTKYHSFWPFGKTPTQHLIADFSALDLVEPSKKKHPVSDKSSYWSLTKIGKQVHKRSRRIQLEEGINTSEDTLDEGDT